MSDSAASLSSTSEREVSMARWEGIEPPDLDKLFNPDSIAIVGASRDLNKSGGSFVRLLLERDYRGAIYPINLRESEILGLRAYPSILAVPGSIDQAVFCVPAAAVPAAMADCAAKRVKFVVVHTSGFSEVGKPDLEAQLLRIAREGGVRFVGPNCMGVLCNDARLSLLATPLEPDVIGADVGFIGQSGTLSDNFMLQGREGGLKINKAVSLGNEADLKFTDYLAYFAADPQIKVIAAYMEGVREGRKLLDLARKVCRRKPVVIWKAGRTTAGSRATLSHTGSIAGSDRINNAAFRQVGIMTANDMETLVDLTVGTYSPFLPKGPRVGILVDTGGGAVSVADACESAGLEVVQLSQGIQQQLRQGLQGHIPPFAGITNPVDLVSPKDEERIELYDFCLELISREVDSLIIISFHDLSDPNFISALEQFRDRLRKPFFMVPALPQLRKEAVKVYTQRSIPSYHSVDRAARSIYGLVEYARWLKSQE